jgi:hypothetical protein
VRASGVRVSIQWLHTLDGTTFAIGEPCDDGLGDLTTQVIEVGLVRIMPGTPSFGDPFGPRCE